MLSLVIPLYNEEAGLTAFHDSLMKDLRSLKHTFEIIYVDDGSSDHTLSLLHTLARRHKNVRVVSLSRNFGKEIAVTAGIAQARGDAVVMLDGDGQHPASKIPDFIDKWENGAQVVIGIRQKNKNEGMVKKLGSRLFYKLFNLLSGTQLVPSSTDYRLIDQSVRAEFIKLNERQRITRGLIDWLGFQRDYVEFKAPARIAGTASYRFSALVQLAANSFISLSLRPLFLLGWVGLAVTSIAVIFGIFVIVDQLILGDPLGLNLTGSAMLGILITFLVGLVLTSQGVMAIYLSHIHSHAQNRPLFVINPRDSRKLDTPKATPYHEA